MALKARKIKTTKGRNWKPHHLALPGLTQQPHWHPPAVGGKAGGTGARCVAGTAGLKTTTLRGVAKNEITQSPQHGQDLLQTPKGRYPTTNLAPPPPRSPRSLSTADSARAPLSTADSAFHPPPLSTADSARGGGGGSAPRTAPGAPLGFLRPSDERGFPCSGGSERKNSAVHLLTPAKTCQLPACISTYGRRDFPGKLRGVGSAIQDGLKERYNHPAHAPRM